MINSGDLSQAIRELNKAIMDETTALRTKEQALHQNETHKLELERAEKADEILIAQKTHEIERLKQEIRDKETKIRENERQHEKLKTEFSESKRSLDREHAELRAVEKNATDLLKNRPGNAPRRF